MKHSSEVLKLIESNEAYLNDLINACGVDVGYFFEVGRQYVLVLHEFLAENELTTNPDARRWWVESQAESHYSLHSELKAALKFPLPDRVLMEMCVCCVLLHSAKAAIDAQKMEFAAVLAIDAAEKLGFVSGAAWQLVSDDEAQREKMAARGRVGGLKRHQMTAMLREWAMKQSENIRGGDIDVARKLAKTIPPALVNASVDPERLIYESIRKARQK